MDYLVPIIEQLARAARELRSRHKIFHRLGYILVDNAAELIVHQYVQQQASMQRQWAINPKLSPRQLQACRRGKFEDKLAVLVALDVLTEPERRFAAICHDYRNEVYHAGLRHEQVIQAIGGAYYRWCCDLFGRLPPMFYSFGGHERPTPLAAALLERVKRDSNVHFVPNVEQIAPYLTSIGPRTPDLAATLNRSAHDAIEAVRRNIEFIRNDAPGRMTVSEIVRDSQKQAELERRLRSEDLDRNILWEEQSAWNRRNEIAQEVCDHFEPHIQQVPFASWKARCASILAQRSELLALNRYQDLRDAMASLEGAIHDFAFQLDMWIQQRIDEARGK